MGRRVPKHPSRGSARWIQTFVNQRPQRLNQAIAASLALPADLAIDWKSPLANDEFAEYQDDAFLSKVGLTQLRRPLRHFWPAGGPVWDALGTGPTGQVFLVESKANVPELVSDPTRAEATSRYRILASLSETQAFMGVTQLSWEVDENGRLRCTPLHTPEKWANTFYQYANRFAHLYFLREWNGVEAYLVFVNFLNDPDTLGPKTQAEWECALTVTERHLGIRRDNPLQRYAAHVFLDVNQA